MPALERKNMHLNAAYKFKYNTNMNIKNLKLNERGIFKFV